MKKCKIRLKNLHKTLRVQCKKNSNLRGEKNKLAEKVDNLETKLRQLLASHATQQPQPTIQPKDCSNPQSTPPKTTKSTTSSTQTTSRLTVQVPSAPKSNWENDQGRSNNPVKGGPVGDHSANQGIRCWSCGLRGHISINCRQGRQLGNWKINKNPQICPGHLGDQGGSLTKKVWSPKENDKNTQPTKQKIPKVDD